MLAEHGSSGEVYNQGSQRTNSVLSYMLLSFEPAGYQIGEVRMLAGTKMVSSPTEWGGCPVFGLMFHKTRVDTLMLEGQLEFGASDRGITVSTSKGQLVVEFDRERLRPTEGPIRLCNTGKIRKLGFETRCTLEDTVAHQLSYYGERKR